MIHTAKPGGLFAFLLPIRTGDSSPARLGLQRLLLLRSFVTLASAIGVIIFDAVSTLDIPFVFILQIIGAVLLSVILGYWRLRISWVVGNVELFSHLLLDVVFLVILLLNTGGVGNPLISYLLVLLAVCATLLSRVYAYCFALGSILIYTSFLLLDLTADHDMSMSPVSEEMTFQLHLIGMWVIFLVSALLISVFITRMAEAIQERELSLAKAREAELSSEQLVAIGTLAAGTAHALGTPLSTMAVLLTELDDSDAGTLTQSRIKEDISLLKQQVMRCKHSLNQLIQYYNKDNPERADSMPLSEFVHDIQDYIVNIHPSAVLHFDLPVENDPQVTANQSCRHAVINILENAIRAAKTAVEVSCTILPGQLEFSIRDDGPGIPAEVLERVGQPFISMRKEHMGLGIYLANAAVHRLGGRIEMFNLKNSGALTVIRLPLPMPQQNSSR